jgi:hypothetical protein
MNTLNIDYDQIKQQRDHLLSILWHDTKGEGQHGLIDEEIGWSVVDLMDNLLNQQESEKNEIYS